MRNVGRLATLGMGVVTLFVVLFSIKFGVRDILFICLGLLFLSAIMWIVGTIEARLIEIRNVLGGSVDDGPDKPRLAVATTGER